MDDEFFEYLAKDVDNRLKGQDHLAKGLKAEAKVLSLLLAADFVAGVLVPFGQHRPYDLVIEVAGKFYSIQTKTGYLRDGVFIFKTSNNRGESYVDIVDFIGAYEDKTQQLFLVPPKLLGRRNGYLRLEPPKSKQRKKIRFAADFGYRRVLYELVGAPPGLSGLFDMVPASE
jgi:hypothetical protein